VVGKTTQDTRDLMRFGVEQEAVWLRSGWFGARDPADSVRAGQRVGRRVCLCREETQLGVTPQVFIKDKYLN
jgi:hypothetical protein